MLLQANMCGPSSYVFAIITVLIDTAMLETWPDNTNIVGELKVKQLSNPERKRTAPDGTRMWGYRM
jgi:hypothetical protein